MSKVYIGTLLAFVVGVNLGCAGKSVEEVSPFLTHGQEPAQQWAYETGYGVVSPEASGAVLLVTRPDHVIRAQNQRLPEIIWGERTEEEKKTPCAKKKPCPFKKGDRPCQKSVSDKKTTEDGPKVGVFPINEESSKLAQQNSDQNQALQKARDFLNERKSNASVRSEGPDLSALDRAWMKYCRNGEDLTDEDIALLESHKYKIPPQYRDRCLPPK
ncbi:hypothetical protein [Geoalkalibacter subterraneus]|uniref:Uncharacterized protein n=1 Tax=Geoalkalibacter subterraneus TaxID=483547 RepID=A0A0B5FL57_9BACT|nr:hypothetical protein [Geoalkalibacter subterraneus]AJF08123.1 hypothetical protein GSUB_16565 [Geoalkalibacter subterraneus]